MADRTIDIDIVAHDYATNVFRNVTGGLSNFQSGLNSAFGRANYIFRSFNNAMRGISNTAVSALKTAGSAIYNFTEDSITQFAKLESTMARTMGVLATGYNFNWGNIQKGTGTTTDNAEYARFVQDRQALTQQTYRLAISGPSGNGSFYNPEEIASAQYELSKGGITAEQMLANDDALTKAVTVFAGANGLDMADAVSYGIQLGAQYDMGTDQWMDMFDMVTWAANQTPNTSVEDMMQALQKVGNVAHGYGVSLEDTLTSLIIMGHSGLKGSQAGSGLATTLTRGISPTGISTAGAPPTENVEEIYNQFKDSIVDENGMFVGMNDYVDMLADVESQLTDQEKAWFNKKLFGLYQTKTALALSKDLGTDIDDESVFSTLSEQLSEQHEDSNQLIYDMVLDSTSGQIEALQNTWDATKMRVGEALKPVTMEVTKQLRQGLETDDFSNIDWDSIRTAVDEAAQNIGDMFGPDAADMMIKISEFVKTVGDFLVDAGQVASVEAPLLGGTLEALVKLLNGDFEGAWDTFTKGIEDTNTAIEGLPEELQGTATAAKNLILMFEGLLALNVVTKVGEVVTALGGLATALNIWKIAHSLTGKGNVSANITATSPNTVVNTTNAQINAGAITTATFGQVGNMTVASASLVNITANIVNVYGGAVNNMGGGGSGGTGGGLPSGAGPTPTLPSTPTFPSLPGGTGGSAMLPFAFGAGGALGAGAAGSAMLPGATGALPALPGAVAGGAGAAGTAGEVITMYYNPLTGSYMTAGQMAGSFAVTGLKVAGLAGLAYVGASIPVENQLQTAYQYGFGTDYANYLGDDYNSLSGLDVGGIAKELLVNGGTWYDDMRNVKVQQFMQNEVNPATPDEYREARDEFFNTINGLKDYEAGKRYLSGIMDRWYWENSNGDSTFISQDQYLALAGALVQAMSSYIEENGITEVSTNALGGPDAGGVPGLGTDIYQNVLDAMSSGLAGESAATAENAAEVLEQASQQFDASTISLKNAIDTLVAHPEMMGVDKLDVSKNIDQYSSKYGTTGINATMEAMAKEWLTTNLQLDPTLMASLSTMNISLDTLVAAVANGISDPELKEAFNTAWGNFESVIAGDMETISGNVISLSEAVQLALENDKIDVLGLGQGPLSDSGACDYIMGQLYSGQTANGTLLSSILSGINAIDPTLTVDITQPAPNVNVDVRVNVDKSGGVTKNVITNYSGADNWAYRASQRYGSTINLQR